MEFKFNVTGSDRKRLVASITEITECPAKYQGAPSFAYDVDYITIDTMHLGLTDGAAQERTPLYPAALKGWGNTVSYHERLKPSYYILQKLWQ